MNFQCKATSKWMTDPPRTRHLTCPSLPVDDFGYRPQDSNYLLESKVSGISQFVLKRTVDSPSPRWNISRYLPTTTRALTRNFLLLLRQVRHIFSDSLEYWYLTREFSSGNIMLLTWSIMSHSKLNSSPYFALNTKRKLLATVYEYAFACLIFFFRTCARDLVHRAETGHWETGCLFNQQINPNED